MSRRPHRHQQNSMRLHLGWRFWRTDDVREWHELGHGTRTGARRFRGCKSYACKHTHMLSFCGNQALPDTRLSQIDYPLLPSLTGDTSSHTSQDSTRVAFGFAVVALTGAVLPNAYGGLSSAAIASAHHALGLTLQHTAFSQFARSAMVTCFRSSGCGRRIRLSARRIPATPSAHLKPTTSEMYRRRPMIQES